MDGKAGASVIGPSGVYLADAMYRYMSGTLGADTSDRRTQYIKVKTGQKAYIRLGQAPLLPEATERLGSVIEVGYRYGKSSVILLHEYVHDFLYILLDKSAESKDGDDYGAIAEAIPGLLAAYYTNH